jgi:hypothetical protein
MRIGRSEVSARCFDVRVVCWRVHIWSRLVAGLFGFFAVVSNRLAGKDGGWWIAVGAVGSLVCRRIGICGVAQAVCVSDRFRLRGRVRVRVRVRIFQSAGMAWGYRFVTLIRIMHDSRCQ